MDEDRIPSEEECYEIIKNHEMLPNILEHSKQVMRVALAISDNARNDVCINRELVIAASLLHDITKTITLTTKEPHDRTGAQLLSNLGFHSIAKIVEEHVIIKNFDPQGNLEEKEIVYYADKRVMHTSIVSVDERIDDILARYGNTPERVRLIIENKELILQVERKINRFLIREINQIIRDI
jgi:uncharacterized protein